MRDVKNLSSRSASVELSRKCGGSMREKKFRETEQIAETIRQLAVPGMKPKALIDAVKEKHPKPPRRI
jgi:hypothetical protein